MSVKEGTAEILMPNAPERCGGGSTEGADPDGTQQLGSVFYNPIQSIAAINTWAADFAYRGGKKGGKAKAADTTFKGNAVEILALRSETAEGNEAETTSAKAPTAFGGDTGDSDATPLKPIRVLEALSASGLRSIRYANECPLVTEIVANDMDPSAVEAMKRNVEHNKVETKVKPSQGDAITAMYSSALPPRTKYQVIDLDPYGTASPFIDAAVYSVDDGGLLLVTCTDMASLAGSQPEACFAKYGAMPVPNAPYCHELALRILLHAIQTSAARYRKVIVPLLSCSIDYYVRVFVKVVESPQLSKKAAIKTGSVYSCLGCKSFFAHKVGTRTPDGKFKMTLGPTVPPACDFCGSKFHVGGPFYAGAIHDAEFVAKMLESVQKPEAEFGTKSRMIGMLTVISEFFINTKRKAKAAKQLKAKNDNGKGKKRKRKSQGNEQTNEDGKDTPTEDESVMGLGEIHDSSTCNFYQTSFIMGRISSDDDDQPLSARTKTKRTAPKSHEEDDSDGSDMPLAKRSRGGTKAESDEDDESFDDDVPLSKQAKAPKKANGSSSAAAVNTKRGETNGSAEPTTTRAKRKVDPDAAEPVAKKTRTRKAAGTPKEKGKKKKSGAANGDGAGDGEQEEEEEEDGWWNDLDALNSGVKWTTLEHKGPLFPPPYEPHGVKMKYNGQEVTLGPEAEEVASFFAACLNQDAATNPVFQANFFRDFMAILKREKQIAGPAIKEFAKCDFTPIYDYQQAKREEKKNMTKEEKLQAKEDKKKIDDIYGWALLNGKKEKVGNYRIEPPGLFKGRGNHPKTGTLKLRVVPEQVTINIGEGVPIPQPPPGHSWEKVVHEPNVTWLAMWKENVNDNIKYVFLAATSSLKGKSDLK
ncbi:DNA topoisomerase 1, partial [Irineochytrium annulatum]